MLSRQIVVYDNFDPVYSVVLDGVIELGRQSDNEEKPYTHQQEADRWRIVIAKLDEQLVSRKQVLVEPLPDGGVRLTNLSKKLPLRLENGQEVNPKSSLVTKLPVVLVLGKKTVRIQEPVEEDGPLQGLAAASLAPAVDSNSVALRFATVALARDSMAVEDLVRWMGVTMDVLHSAASSTEFFARAARAVVELVGLDSACVLLREGDMWKEQLVQRRRQTMGEPEMPPSRQVLRRVQQEKRTFWQVPRADRQGSLIGIHAVVAAPILDRHGEVIGALYGDRRQDGATRRPLTKLQAMLVELLAGGVAAGLARVEMEQTALRARVQFEQFFTPELARELEAHPDLLQGRDQEVTVLFADIRHFSRISGRLGSAGTVVWINHVMDVLSACVREHGGVLVDYIGDELIAMWGAPLEQPDHASRGCAAALAMVERLPQLQAHWLPVLQEPMDLGIGLNSGTACVGNMGSTYKFKYGPLGNTINLASRVQGATRYLKTRLLITNATQKHLSADFATRRLFQVRVVNIEEPVLLYELVGAPPPGWTALKQGYEQALDHFEKQEFLEAAHLLGELLPAHPADGPLLILMSQAANCLVQGPGAFDPVWTLPGK